MTPTDIATMVAWTYLVGVSLSASGLGVVFLYALVIGHRWNSSPKQLWNYACLAIALWPLTLGTIIHAVTSKKEPS